MKAIIIDDDRKAVEQLQACLTDFPEVEVVGTAYKASSGVKLFREKKPDVVFLDVEMPDMSGLDVLDDLDIGANDADIVMCTAYESYMLPAFRGNAFDFLLKPIDRQELQVVIQRLGVNHEKRRQAKKEPVKDSVRRSSDDSFIFYTNAVDFRIIKLRDIGVFQYNHTLRCWEVVLADTETPIRLRRNITKEQLLSLDNTFGQVSQKYIINTNYIKGVEDNTCIFYPPFDFITHVKVGRFFRKRFIERFNKF